MWAASTARRVAFLWGVLSCFLFFFGRRVVGLVRVIVCYGFVRVTRCACSGVASRWLGAWVQSRSGRAAGLCSCCGQLVALVRGCSRRWFSARLRRALSSTQKHGKSKHFLISPALPVASGFISARPTAEKPPPNATASFHHMPTSASGTVASLPRARYAARATGWQSATCYWPRKRGKPTT